MLKKGIAAAALLAAASSVYAGGPEAPPPAYIGGAYVDVGLSRDDVYDSFRGNALFIEPSIVDDDAVRIATTPTNYRVDAGARGWDGFLGVGYTYVWDNEWTLGAEIFGDASSARGTQIQGSTAVNLITGSSATNYLNLRAEHTFGVSFMPGYFIAPGSLYFLELGYVNSEFDLTGYPTPYAGTSDSFGSQPSREVNQSGFRLGFGTNTQVGSHVAIRQEYVWETYGNFWARRALSAQTDSQGTILTSSHTNAVRVSPNISKFNLAAVYYFAQQGNAPDLNAAPAHVGGHFYAGLNGSYDEDYSHTDFWSSRIVVTNNTTHNVVSDRINSENNALMKITGWNIGLLAGYGWNFTNRWYMGAELFGNYDNVNGRYYWSQGETTATVDGVAVAPIDPAGSVTSRFEKNWDFGAALIPGYQVSDAALLYARVGYVGADFEIRNSWVGSTDLALTAAQNLLLSRSRSSWLSGFQLGVGVDTLVYQNLSLRTEFNINNFGNYNLNTVVANTDNGTQTTVQTVSTRHRHIIEDQFNVALIWHFFG